MPEIERDGEELPRLSPGVGCDSTAQGDKVTGGVGSTACAPNVPYSIMSRYLIGCGYGKRWKYCVCTQCTMQH